jgi:hypothetical protein
LLESSIIKGEEETRRRPRRASQSEVGKEAGGEVDDRGNDALLLKDALEASILSERETL